MANLKLNKKIDNNAFDVIPDIPSVSDVAKSDNANKTTSNTNNDTFIKKEETEERKLFANKKANIALGIASGVIVVGIIAAAIYAYM